MYPIGPLGRQFGQSAAEVRIVDVVASSRSYKPITQTVAAALVPGPARPAGRPNALGAMVFGTQRLDVPLSGTLGCRLYTDPALLHFYRTDLLGHAAILLPIPRGTSFGNVQMVNAFDQNGTLQLLSSEAFTVLCR